MKGTSAPLPTAKSQNMYQLKPRRSQKRTEMPHHEGEETKVGDLSKYSTYWEPGEALDAFRKTLPASR